MNVGDHDLSTDPDCQLGGDCLPPNQIIRVQEIMTYIKLNVL